MTLEEFLEMQNGAPELWEDGDINDVVGGWPGDSVQRAFVAGAQWWEFVKYRRSEAARQPEGEPRCPECGRSHLAEPAALNRKPVCLNPWHNVGAAPAEGMGAEQEFEKWAHARNLHTQYPEVVYDQAWAAWQAAALQVRQEGERRENELMQLLEYCRSILADGVTAIKKAVQGREWLTEGRGPYEWDDERWHNEFAAAAKEILDAVEPLAKEAADWSNCPKTALEVTESRRNLM